MVIIPVLQTIWGAVYSMWQMGYSGSSWQMTLFWIECESTFSICTERMIQQYLDFFESTGECLHSSGARQLCAADMLENSEICEG